MWGGEGSLRKARGWAWGGGGPAEEGSWHVNGMGDVGRPDNVSLSVGLTISVFESIGKMKSDGFVR